MTYIKMNCLLYLSINPISWNIGYNYDPSISLETSLTLKDIFLLCIHLSSSKHHLITSLSSRWLSRTDLPHVQHMLQQWPPNFGGPQLLFFNYKGNRCYTNFFKSRCKIMICFQESMILYHFFKNKCKIITFFLI